MAEADLLQLLSTFRVISQHTRPAMQLCLQVLNLLAACRQLRGVMLSKAGLILMGTFQLIDAAVGFFTNAVQLCLKLSTVQLEVAVVGSISCQVLCAGLQLFFTQLQLCLYGSGLTKLLLVSLLRHA